MAIQTDARIETTHIAGSESNHWICTNGCALREGRIYALCGTDVTDMEESNECEVDCVVCMDIEYCPICDPPKDCDG